MAAVEEQISPIWQAAIDRYYAELESGGMKRTPIIDKDLWAISSPSVLINEIQTMVPQETQVSRVWTTVMPKLEPVLFGLNDFAAVIAWSLGMDGRVAALLWGSTRLLLKFATPVFPDLISLLEEVKAVLPKASLSEQDFPFSKALEEALLNLYTEIIVFYAFAITFFRNNPNVKTSRHAWSEFSLRFQKVISNLRTYSRKVDEIADMMRLSKETHSAETAQALSSLKSLMITDHNLPCYIIPYGLNLKFSGRSTEMQDLHDKLSPETEGKGLRVVAICGLGGVGKTQLALNYANVAMKSYDAVAWIQADTQIKLVQSLATFATKLGLQKREGSEDDSQSVSKVRDWLNTSGKRFLMIFDNLEDVKILSQIWPSSEQGSIIITSRSPTIASRRAKHSMLLKSFDDEEAMKVLVGLTGSPPADNADRRAAQKICELIGGLPLALVHMSSFIADRGYSYEEFLSLYQKHTERIFNRQQSVVDYDHTLNTVWDLSLESIADNSRTLLNTLSFFDPDTIAERLLINPRVKFTDPRFGFFQDEFDFGDALAELMTKTSLVNRITTSKSLSLHRLVKFSMFIRVPEDERGIYLDSVIQMLSQAFPNTWDQRGDTQGHGYESWETCSAIVAHLSSLMSLQTQYNFKATNVPLFAELVFRIGTYLWESEQPLTAKAFFEYGLGLDIDPNSRLTAQAYRLLGHIALDVAMPRAAFAAYMKAYEARQKLDGPDSLAVAEVLDSLACACAEIGNVSEALGYLAQADEINFAIRQRTSGRTQAIYSLAYLRGDQPEKSHEALQLCWKLQDKTEEDIANSPYPKHAGDIVLLARIQFALGKKDEAQRLASRSITIRRGIFGAKGPRVADSLFTVARMLESKGEDVIAAKTLGEIIDMSRDMVEMQGHLARALWFSAAVEDRLDNPDGALMFRQKAKEERLKIPGREGPDEDTDAAFMSLVGWMLW